MLNRPSMTYYVVKMLELEENKVLKKFRIRKKVRFVAYSATTLSWAAGSMLPTRYVLCKLLESILSSKGAFR